MSESAIAVVGTGYIGVEHVKAIEGNPAARLHTICSTPRSEDAAQSLGDIHSAEKVTTCFSDVIENPEVDTVYLCTPNSQHVAQAVAALDVGKHLFVEKPLAVTVAECQQIVDAARRSGTKVMVGHGARFVNLFTAVKKMVEDGLLGEACFVEGDYVHDLGPFLDLPGHDWWMDAEKEGQLPIIGGACHPLDLMRWFSGGQVVEVCGYANHVAFEQMQNDDCQVALFRFDDGGIAKVASLYGPRRACPLLNNLRIYGTLGTIEQDRIAVARQGIHIDVLAHRYLH